MRLPKLAFPGGRAKTTTIYYPAPATTAGRPRPGTAEWRRFALVAVAVAGLLLAGCGSSHPSSASPGPAFPSTPAGVQARSMEQAVTRMIASLRRNGTLPPGMSAGAGLAQIFQQPRCRDGCRCRGW